LTTDSGVPQDMLNSFNFSATWGYPQGPTDEPVHAFPNAQLITGALPLRISAVQNLYVDVDWTYAIGDDAAAVADTDSLVAGNLNCNVAIDMFFDSNGATAHNESIASHEVMVWLGQYGLSTQPLGLSSTPADTAQVNGTTLYATPLLLQPAANTLSVTSTTPPTPRASRCSPGSPRATRPPSPATCSR
jgi:hypothetical protein